MSIFGEDFLSLVDWDSCSSISSFSGSRYCPFSNAGSHRFDHIKVDFQGLFFSDQNRAVDKELAQLASVCYTEGGENTAQGSRKACANNLRL